MRKLAVIAGLLALTGLGLWQAGLLAPEPAVVEATAAARGPVRETVSSVSAGTVKPHREATVAARSAGRVAEIRAREGETVEAGEVVCRLVDDVVSREVEVAEAGIRTAEARGAVAEARLAGLETRLGRMEALDGPAAPSADALDELRTKRDVAARELRAARRRIEELSRQAELAGAHLERTRVEAPFGGTIRDLHVEVGEYVAPGAPLFDLMDASSRYVEAPIDEVDRPRVSVGQPVDISLQAYPDRTVRGRVRQIAPAVSTDRELNRTAWVRVDLPAEAADLPVGLSADLEIVVAGVDGVPRIPSHALHEERRAGDSIDHWVWVIEEGRARRRSVEVGLQNWDWTEVREGLAPDDRVIVSHDVEGLAAEPRVREGGAGTVEARETVPGSAPRTSR